MDILFKLGLGQSRTLASKFEEDCPCKIKRKKTIDTCRSRPYSRSFMLYIMSHKVLKDKKIKKEIKFQIWTLDEMPCKSKNCNAINRYLQVYAEVLY